MLVSGIRSVAYDGRFIAIAIAQLRVTCLPTGVIEIGTAPSRALVRAIIEIFPGRSRWKDIVKGGGAGSKERDVVGFFNAALRLGCSVHRKSGRGRVGVPVLTA